MVIHTPRLSLPYAAQNADVVRLLAAGKNVVSTAGFHYPQAHAEDYVAPLREACVRGRSTLAGIGINPGFIGERLALMMTGLCARLDAVRTFETVDASQMPSPAFVFDTMGFGADPAAVDITRGPLAGLYGALYRETLAYMADGLGARLAEVRADHRVTLAPADLRIVAGTTDSVAASTRFVAIIALLVGLPDGVRPGPWWTVAYRRQTGLLPEKFRSLKIYLVRQRNQEAG